MAACVAGRRRTTRGPLSGQSPRWFHGAVPVVLTSQSVFKALIADGRDRRRAVIGIATVESTESKDMDPILERNRIRELLQRADVAILVTTDYRGAHAGRPMLPLWLPNDPHIYFLTHQDSGKVTQIVERPQVVLTILSADRYFVVLGSADASRDPELIRRLWHPSYRAW